MSYDQHMKHFSNHRKDRFLQQCSGYFGESKPEKVDYSKSEEIASIYSKTSMNNLLCAEHAFPIYVHQDSAGFWEIVPKNHLFGTLIQDRESLEAFASEYAY